MIKIDIITGFLGSGKTTLITKILKSFINKDEKVVLIENEFGKVGIDGKLLNREGFEVFELTSGCICCTLKDDFEFTLSEIIEKIKPDRIIFEPSGIFILDEIINLLKNPAYSSSCYINSIVAVVDSVNFLKQNSKYSLFFENQISKASMIILSKTVSITKDDIMNIKLKLRSINSTAEIITKGWDSLSPEDINRILGYKPQVQEVQPLKCKGYSHSNTHEHHEFDSFGTKTAKVFDKDILIYFLNLLQDDAFGNILRAKGILKGFPKCCEFSYVNGQYTIKEIESTPEGVVSFIGTNLDINILSQFFAD